MNELCERCKRRPYDITILHDIDSPQWSENVCWQCWKNEKVIEAL